MSWTPPQGIDFRTTLGFVTDPANCVIENAEVLFTANYPRTLPNGNVVGWEISGTGSNSRDRNAGNDPRLAGLENPASDYRIDIAAGNYNIYIAAGDASNSQGVSMAIKDTTTVLRSLSGSTGAANSFIDASNTVRTAAAWVAASAGGGTAFAATFATSIARFSMSGASPIAHIFIESASGGPKLSWWAWNKFGAQQNV